MTISRFFQQLLGLASEREAAPEPAAIDQVLPASATVAVFDYTDNRIPDASRNHIAKVLALIAELEKAAVSQAISSPLLIEIRQLSEVHLPTLIKSYLDIPAAHRAEIFRKTGRSASFLLNEGLDKLADRLRAMSLSLAQNNIDAFTSTMRFIDLRYGANEFSSD